MHCKCIAYDSNLQCIMIITLASVLLLILTLTVFPMNFTSEWYFHKKPTHLTKKYKHKRNGNLKKNICNSSKEEEKRWCFWILNKHWYFFHKDIFNQLAKKYFPIWTILLLISVNFILFRRFDGWNKWIPN